MRLFLTMLFFICIEASSQELPSLKKYDLSSYNRKLCRNLKNLECTRKNESRSVIFIYHLKLDRRVDKKEFTASFLKSNLGFIENPETDFPRNDALIYNDSLRVVASCDQLRVFCEYENKYFQALLTLALSSSFDLVFHISGTNGVIYFGSKKGEIFVIDPTVENSQLYGLKEFVDCCWEKL